MCLEWDWEVWGLKVKSGKCRHQLMLKRQVDDV